jgi:phenylpropionate dioxygenase-like ring-hydroxylating dioxygenase large terminal subunit
MTAHAEHKTSFVLLDREYYTSPEVFAKEYERIYSRDWIYAGHVSQFPLKGSYIKFEIGGEEIVVVRGDGEEFYANLNVCRHRGYRLCGEDSGRVRALVCPYHQWRYDFDGTLTRVPQMRDGEYFDYADFPLRTAETEVWNGFVFVHLGEGKVEPLRERLTPFHSVVARFDPAGTKLVHEENYILDANWKVAFENAMECYHCAGTHKVLTSVIDVAGLQADLKKWLADEDGDADLGVDGMRLAAGKQTLSADGRLITDKLLGTLTQDDVDAGASGGVWVDPNFFYAAFYVDHFWTITIRPISENRTHLLYSWFVRSDAEEGVDFDMGRLIEVGHTTQTEDNALIERTQSGIGSRYFRPGPIGSDVEPALHDFVTDYLKLMA